jgi:hypothetical protein
MADTKETKSTTKDEKVIELKDKISFPKEFSKIVYLRRIPAHAKLPGQNPDDADVKVGSSYKGSAVLRGLTFEEEQKYLPEIMGISPTSQDWSKETRNYWGNITKKVPPRDGVELQIGLFYLSEADYEYDQNLTPELEGNLINHKGKPINLADYILWRYCLLYSRVANNESLIGMSPKIEMYLYSKDKEVADKKKILNSKRRAHDLYFKNIVERDWVDYILTVLVAQDKNPERKVSTVQQLQALSEDEKDLLLDNYATTSPDIFVLLGENKDLQMKAFVELCVAAGKLTRIANTDTITMDGTPIGNTLTEAVAFMNNAKNNQVLQTLKAQVKLTL